MDQTNTLFKYLHDALVMQIESGKLTYGDKLPAMRSLRELYNVGIRTVRNVMETLIQEGYIESVERSHMMVSYRTDDDVVKQAENVLARRDSVVQLIITLEHIMPHIFGEAAKLCDNGLLQSCRDDIVGTDRLTTKEHWRKSRIPFQRLTTVYHNSLLQDLCIDVDLFSQITIVPGLNNPYDTVVLNLKTELSGFFDSMLRRDCTAVTASIRNMCHTAHISAAAYFSVVQSMYPQLKPEQATYSWNAEKGRLRTYMQVTRDIVKKISNGVYPDGTYLPTNSKLCEEYKISPYTVSKVMEELERIGLIKQMNLRGGFMITCELARTKAILVHESASSTDAITHLSALHILALISKGVAELGFPYLDNESIRRMSYKIDNMKSLSQVPGFLSSLVQAQPYEPLKSIYAQLAKLLDWGHYFVFAFDEKPYFDSVLAQIKIARGYIDDHDKDAFTNELQNIYYYVFKIMQQNLLKFGITDAEKIILP